MTGDKEPVELAALGDSAILLTLGDAVERELNRRVRACVNSIKAAGLAGVMEVVPAYASLAVHYDAAAVGADEMMSSLREIVQAPPPDKAELASGALVTIPVQYNGADLPAVAEATGLSAEEVIARHSAVEYYVYMIGFTPGFAYLGDVEPALRLPRREVPRARVPRGSVAIAGAQTAVYPHETPGGWHLIGTTDLLLFDPRRDSPALLRAGDRVRFEPVV